MGNSILGGGFSSASPTGSGTRGASRTVRGPPYRQPSRHVSPLSIFAICNPTNMPKVETGAAEELSAGSRVA